MANTPWNSRSVLGFPPTGGQSGFGNEVVGPSMSTQIVPPDPVGSRVMPGNGRGPLLNEPFTKTPFQATMNGQPYDNSGLRGGFGGGNYGGFGGGRPGGFGGQQQMPYAELMRALMARRGPRQSDPLPPADRPMGARRY